jgi:hypothetical protein
MEMIPKAVFFAAAMLPAIGAAHAGDYDWEDIFAPYRQRIDTATTSSGNAQNVNAATHMITPWPPYVRNRRIPGNGARMVGAIKRYRGEQAQAQPGGGGPTLLENLLKPAAPAGGAQQSGAANTSVSAPTGE